MRFCTVHTVRYQEQEKVQCLGVVQGRILGCLMQGNRLIPQQAEMNVLLSNLSASFYKRWPEVKTTTEKQLHCLSPQFTYHSRFTMVHNEKTSSP